MTPTTIYQGTRAPVTMTLTVQQGDSGRDLSTVTAASFSIRCLADRSTTTWTAALGTQSATTLVLTHTFDAAGAETTTRGDYRMIARLTVTGGQWQTPPVPFTIQEAP
jgi:hypothetical protein